MQTAIEYIFEQLEEQGLIFLTTKTNEMTISISASDYLDIKRLAKEMEKQQIIDAYQSGDGDAYNLDATKEWGEEYYNETYGSKGSDNQFDVEKEMFELEGQLIDSYPISEETKPHSFCETPEEKCTMSYCDENGCINRKRNLAGEPKLPASSQTEISDEEIEKAAIQIWSALEEEEFVAWKNGAKWYREQLKTKQ